jgi:hypothetical protein
MIRFQVIAPKHMPNKGRVLDAIRNALQDTVSEGHRFISRYPPQTLTKSGYIRTMTLGRSWSSRVVQLGDRMEGIVGSNSNMAPYNRYVQGKMSERARIFSGTGWENADTLKANMESELPRRVQEAVKSAL